MKYLWFEIRLDWLQLIYTLFNNNLLPFVIVLNNSHGGDKEPIFHHARIVRFVNCTEKYIAKGGGNQDKGKESEDGSNVDILVILLYLLFVKKQIVSHLILIRDAHFLDAYLTADILIIANFILHDIELI